MLFSLKNQNKNTNSENVFNNQNLSEISLSISKNILFPCMFSGFPNLFSTRFSPVFHKTQCKVNFPFNFIVCYPKSLCCAAVVVDFHLISDLLVTRKSRCVM